jgi:hypothetical protein
MNHYKRPEKELDPNKLPGQIINRPPGPDTLQHNIEEYKRYEKERNMHIFPNCRCQFEDQCVPECPKFQRY